MVNLGFKGFRIVWVLEGVTVHLPPLLSLLLHHVVMNGAQ